MDYPQLHIPTNIREIITTNHFPKPNKPAEPKEPIKENNLKTKIIFGIIGLIIYKCDYQIIGILIILACLYWIYRNPEKISYEKAYQAYKKSYEKYSKEYDNFSNELNLYTNNPTEYNNNYRKRSLRKSLIASSSSCYEKDYKKGVTHDFFKMYLKKYFADKISEDIAIKKYKFNGYYSHNDYKPYVTDFAYINIDTGLSIDIEIDEPYTLSKKPIHLNDKDRNNFFLENNWIIIRFSEEQIILNPILCCEYIKKIVFEITESTNPNLSITHNIPITKKWTNSSVIQLITLDYRNSYLKKLNDVNHIACINLMNQLMSFGAPLTNIPDEIL